METTGAKPHEIVRAYLLAREIFGFVALWQAIEALDNKVDDAVQMEMLDRLEPADRARHDVVPALAPARRRHGGDDRAVHAARRSARVAAAGAHGRRGPGARRRRGRRVRRRAACREALAARVVALDTLYSTLDIVESRRRDDVGRSSSSPTIYFSVSTRLGMPWLRDKIAALPEDQHWRRLAEGRDAGRPVGRCSAR